MRQDGQSLTFGKDHVIEHLDLWLGKRLTAGQATITLITLPVFAELLSW
jgi:hypothetical protein